jgi:putative transposase
LGLKDHREIIKTGMKLGLSERRACQVLNINRSSVRYHTKGLSKFTLAVEKKTIELAKAHQVDGYKMITDYLRRLGYPTGRTRVWNIWQRNGLSLPIRRKRKKTRIPHVRPCKATKINEVWCYDFLFVQTEHGETLKIFAVLDEYSRECLAIYVNRKINSENVKEVLAQIIEKRGKPDFVRSDNGPEFISKNLRQWLGKRGIRPQYIDPGSPWQNGFIESFNGKIRAECLNREMLWSRGETQSVCNWWKHVYNYFRPHSSLGRRTPKEFAQGAEKLSYNQTAKLVKIMAQLN